MGCSGYKTHDGLSVLVRAALLCFARAGARKFCGFVGHSGTKWCVQGPCYHLLMTDLVLKLIIEISGHFVHCLPIKLHQKSIKKLNQKKTDKETRIKYSILKELSCFDAPRTYIADRMSNLLLGTSKNIIENMEDNWNTVRQCFKIHTKMGWQFCNT